MKKAARVLIVFLMIVVMLAFAFYIIGLVLQQL